LLKSELVLVLRGRGRRELVLMPALLELLLRVTTTVALRE